MSDLGVKLFLFETKNPLISEDNARRYLTHFGLLEEYDRRADEMMEFLGEEAFTQGIEFLAEIVGGLRFGAPPELDGTEYCRGIEFAMQNVNALVRMAVDGARMTNEQVEQEAIVRDAMPAEMGLSVDQVLRAVSAVFDNHREPTSR